MNMKSERARRVVKFVLLAIVLFPLLGFLIMALWNGLMPTLFGLPAIGFWQAWGLFLPSKILFGSFRGQPGRHHRHGHLRERWAHMTDAERDAFRRGAERHSTHAGSAAGADSKPS